MAPYGPVIHYIGDTEFSDTTIAQAEQTLTSGHHRRRLVEECGQAVVDSALFGHLQRYHRACPRHQLCSPENSYSWDSEYIGLGR